MKKRICALVAALLLLGAASAAPAPLPEGMAYLAACRVEGETTGGVTFAVTQAAYDGARLTLEVLFNGLLPPPVQPQDDFFMLCHAHRPLSASLRMLLQAAWVWPQEQTYCPHTPAPLPGLPIHRAAAAHPPCAAARKTAAP